MGIAAGVAVAWEVFGAAEHPSCLHAPHKGRCQRPGCGWIFPPGPHIDYRVGRVVVDIAHRPQHPVEPQAPGISARALPVAFG